MVTTRKLTISENKFSHESGEASFELIEAADKEILIVSVKRNKEHITTTFKKADLEMLSEFLKLRGVK